MGDSNKQIKMKVHFLLLIALTISAPEIWGSNMILTENQKALFGFTTSNSSANGASLSGQSKEYYRWPNGVVPYKLTGFRYAERRRILQTISTLNDKLNGCINIRPYSSNSDVDYVDIFKGRGCWSYVGRIGGNQSLSLGNGCIYTRTITHELLRALGLFHEHQRMDRDYCVEIHRENVYLDDHDFQINFAECTGCEDYGIPYNIESVMHYKPTSFAKSNWLQSYRSITALDSTKQSRMGTSTELGMYDELLLRKMYNCISAQYWALHFHPSFNKRFIPD